jgi:hypothetical protein
LGQKKLKFFETGWSVKGELCINRDEQIFKIISLPKLLMAKLFIISRPEKSGNNYSKNLFS